MHVLICILVYYILDSVLSMGIPWIRLWESEKIKAHASRQFGFVIYSMTYWNAKSGANVASETRYASEEVSQVSKVGKQSSVSHATLLCSQRCPNRQRTIQLSLSNRKSRQDVTVRCPLCRVTKMWHTEQWPTLCLLVCFLSTLFSVINMISFFFVMSFLETNDHRRREGNITMTCNE